MQNDPFDVYLCTCGCFEADHKLSGECCYCGPEDCGGFTYDEDATLLYLAGPPEEP
jgi:hypothetical protein